MPALCRPVQEGGVGFDYRLGMGEQQLPPHPVLHGSTSRRSYTTATAALYVIAGSTRARTALQSPARCSCLGASLPPCPCASQACPPATVFLPVLQCCTAGLPDYWIELLKHAKDEEWRMTALVGRLCDRCAVQHPPPVPGSLALRDA